MKRKKYDKQLRKLQVELCYLQRWVKERGLRVITVRLTAHPRPVDGLVVAQSPGPATRARRGTALTVQVWHPPARTVVPGHVVR